MYQGIYIYIFWPKRELNVPLPSHALVLALLALLRRLRRRQIMVGEEKINRSFCYLNGHSGPFIVGFIARWQYPRIMRENAALCRDSAALYRTNKGVTSECHRNKMRVRTKG